MTVEIKDKRERTEIFVVNLVRLNGESSTVIFNSFKSKSKQFKLFERKYPKKINCFLTVHVYSPGYKIKYESMKKFFRYRKEFL